MSTTSTAGPTTSRNRRTWGFVGLGLLVALLLAGVASYYASSSPDGLEKVAADKGLDAKAKPHSLGDSPFSDYGVSGIGDARLSVGVAGVVGVGVTFLVAGGMFLLVRRRGDDPVDPPAGGDPSGS